MDYTQDCTPHRGIRIVARNSVGGVRDAREVCGGGRDAAVVLLSGVGGGGGARAYGHDKRRPRDTRRRGDDAATSAVKGRDDNVGCGAPGNRGTTEPKAVAGPQTRYASRKRNGLTEKHNI